MEKTIKILLVDDHPSICHALRLYLGRTQRFHVVDQVERGVNIPMTLQRCQPDLVMLDLELERGFEPEDAVAQIRKLAPSARIAVYTAHRKLSLVLRMVELKVDGYILKTERMTTVAQFLQDIVRGERKYSLGAALVLADAYHHESLNTTERAVLQMLGDGKSVRQIAAAMHIAERTARSYLQRAASKLGTESRVGAVAEAIRQGQIL
jgi:DNA-binding NarL/FixJ family response regulator